MLITDSVSFHYPAPVSPFYKWIMATHRLCTAVALGAAQMGCGSGGYRGVREGLVPHLIRWNLMW